MAEASDPGEAKARKGVGDPREGRGEGDQHGDDEQQREWQGCAPRAGGSALRRKLPQRFCARSRSIDRDLAIVRGSVTRLAGVGGLVRVGHTQRPVPVPIV